MTLPSYPLAQVIEVKQRRVEEAEKAVRQKQEALLEEEKKLKKAEDQRDKAKQHRNDKLQQLRDYIDADDMNPDKVLQMKAYLDLVKQKLLEEEEKVKKQALAVEEAKKNLQAAKDFLKEKEKEVDKLQTHREEWLKQAKKELELKETIELDEIGSIMFLKKLREKQ